HHHRPGFRGESCERSGLGAGCRRARAPRPPFPETAVRLGRFPAVGEPVDRSVVACENPLPESVPGGFARTDTRILRALLPRDAKRGENRAGAGGPGLTVDPVLLQNVATRCSLMARRFLPGLVVAMGLLALGLLIAFTVGQRPVGDCIGG